jgi:hypothetical protein
MPIGSNFDDFLKEQGTYELCIETAIRSTLKLGSFNAADYLNDEETIAACIAPMLANADSAVCLQAVNDVVGAYLATNLPLKALT